MRSVIIFDIENLTNATSPERHWNGPHDPDPQVVQIGAVKLGLTNDFPLIGELDLTIRPIARDGAPARLDPFFQEFTGLTHARIERDGLSLADALARLDTFADDARLWSWGKDELRLMAISCYVEGIDPPLPVGRFGNASDLLLSAGLPHEEVVALRSHSLPARFGLPDQGRDHDALADARGVAVVIQHLLRRGDLDAAALRA